MGQKWVVKQESHRGAAGTTPERPANLCRAQSTTQEAEKGAQASNPPGSIPGLLLGHPRWALQTPDQKVSSQKRTAKDLT